MFKSLPYRKKNKLLFLTAVVVLFIMYQISIKETVRVFQGVQDKTEKLSLLEHSSITVSQLEKELVLISSKMQGGDTCKKENSKKLIEFLTHYCNENGSIINNLPETKFEQQGDIVIETNQFTVAGDFNTLLKLVYQLEQKNKIGKISSVNYSTHKDFKTKQNVLTATIYLQKIKRKSNE